MTVIDESFLLPTGTDAELYPIVITLSTFIATDGSVKALDTNPYA